MPTYTIPLRSEVIKTQRYKRAKRAIRTVQSFIAKHLKTTNVKIETHLNNELWKHGIRNFPKNVKVNAEKDDKDVVRVELFGYEAPKPSEKAPKSKAKKAEPVEKTGEANEKTVEEKAEDNSKSEVEKPVQEPARSEKENTARKPTEPDNENKNKSSSRPDKAAQEPSKPDQKNSSN